MYNGTILNKLMVVRGFQLNLMALAKCNKRTSTSAITQNWGEGKSCSNVREP